MYNYYVFTFPCFPQFRLSLNVVNVFFSSSSNMIMYGMIYVWLCLCFNIGLMLNAVNFVLFWTGCRFSISCFEYTIMTYYYNDSQCLLLFLMFLPCYLPRLIYSCIVMNIFFLFQNASTVIFRTSSISRLFCVFRWNKDMSKFAFVAISSNRKVQNHWKISKNVMKDLEWWCFYPFFFFVS